MVNLSEHRLGNVVMFNGQPDFITEIGQAGNGYCKSNGYFNSDKGYIEPIPLTPEWLERCGFEKKNMLQPDFYTWWRNGMGEYLTFHHDGFCVFEFGNRRIISHLHQLQNLYFALTGEELTINHECNK